MSATVTERVPQRAPAMVNTRVSQRAPQTETARVNERVPQRATPRVALQRVTPRVTATVNKRVPRRDTTRPMPRVPQRVPPITRAPPTANNSDNPHGKPVSKLMKPTGVALLHPFSSNLQEWHEKGMPVDCGDPWSRQAIEESIKRGNHVSATTKEAIDIIKSDVDYQIKAGFTKLIPWETIKDDPPENLKISPVAVIFYKERRGRILMDLSFPVKLGNKIIHQSVNETTRQQAPLESLDQLGKVMNRMVGYMTWAPNDKPVRFSVWDISDGFWRVCVDPAQAWNFCFVYPTKPGEPIMIAVPEALYMGWMESPHYFGGASETARDVAASILNIDTGKPAMLLAPHGHEKYVQYPQEKHQGELTAITVHRQSCEETALPVYCSRHPPPKVTTVTLYTNPMKEWVNLEVYVDDYIAMA
jgi:hypothetical protein